MNPPIHLPSGVLALAGEALRRQRAVERVCLERLAAAGFQEVMLPVLEYAGAEPDDGYRFLDRSGRLLALRTDFTPLAARVLGPGLRGSALPAEICYAGEVVRPRPARLRQLPELFQLGFESYGVSGGGARALALALEITALTGVPAGGCHVAIGVAGLAELLLAQLLEEPVDEELLALTRVRDVDALIDLLGVHGVRAAALEAALLGEPPAAWAETLAVADALEPALPLLDAAARAGVAASFELAPRLAGGYYRGAVFAVWGRSTRAVLAAGGEYLCGEGEQALPAAGACLTLGICLEEAVERGAPC